MKKIKFDAGDNPELANRKKFTTKDLVSFSVKTEGQRNFLKSFYSQIPFIIQKGYPGTGKSTIALYAAFSEVFDEMTPYDKVVIVRSAVQTRAIGFMPGNEEEKTEPYEKPYKNITSDIIKYKNPYNNLKALNYLEFMLTTHIRGLTFDRCIMILDEVQNMDSHEIFSVLTRAGEQCKIIVCGDKRQDDLFRQKEVSGFDYVNKLSSKMKNYDVVEYTIDDIVRSDLCKEIIIADSLLC